MTHLRNADIGPVPHNVDPDMSRFLMQVQRLLRLGVANGSLKAREQSTVLNSFGDIIVDGSLTVTGVVLVPSLSAVGHISSATLSTSGDAAFGNDPADTVRIQAGSAALPALTRSGAPGTGLWFPADDVAAVSSAGVERIRWTLTLTSVTGDLAVSGGAAVDGAVTADSVAAAGAVTADTVSTSGNVSVGGVLAVPAGSAAAPSVTRTGDDNTGVLFPADDVVAVAVGGAEIMRWTGTGVAITGTLATTGQITAPSIQVSGAVVAESFTSTGSVTVGDASIDTITVQAGSAALPSVIPAGDENTGLWFPSADTVAVSVGGVETLRVSAAGTTVSQGSIGYGAGSGGTVTQTTSKATGVTLNKTCGEITMDAAMLAGATAVSFTLTNSTIGATDVPVLTIKSGATVGSYLASISAVSAGSATITLRNLTAAPLSEAVVLSFAIMRAVAA